MLTTEWRIMGFIDYRVNGSDIKKGFDLNVKAIKGSTRSQVIESFTEAAANVENLDKMLGVKVTYCEVLD